MSTGGAGNNTGAPNPKQRLIASLAAQLQTLAERTRHLDQLTLTTAEQAKYMRSLGGLHAAWFMAANRVLTPNDVDEPAAAQQSAEDVMVPQDDEDGDDATVVLQQH